MIVGVSGYAGAGKDSVARVLVERQGMARYAFADAIKAVLADIDPFVTELGEWDDRLSELDRPDPAQPGGIDWERVKLSSEVRRLLQSLGVAARAHIHPDVWVDAVMRRIDAAGGDAVISDVRFPNEARAIKERGGIIWRVARPGVGPANAHESETALDRWPFDATIANNGTLDDLAAAVQALAAQTIGAA